MQRKCTLPIFPPPPPPPSLSAAEERPSVAQLFESLEYGPAPESPSVVNAWLDDHKRAFGHFIGNQWVKPQGRKTYDSLNPVTGEKLASTLQGGEL